MFRNFHLVITLSEGFYPEKTSRVDRNRALRVYACAHVRAQLCAHASNIYCSKLHNNKDFKKSNAQRWVMDTIYCVNLRLLFNEVDQICVP